MPALKAYCSPKLQVFGDFAAVTQTGFSFWRWFFWLKYKKKNRPEDPGDPGCTWDCGSIS